MIPVVLKILANGGGELYCSGSITDGCLVTGVHPYKNGWRFTTRDWFFEQNSGQFSNSSAESLSAFNVDDYREKYERLLMRYYSDPQDRAKHLAELDKRLSAFEQAVKLLGKPSSKARIGQQFKVDN